MFKLGLVINPFAGIGGAMAFKGSDGQEVRQQALAMGAEKKANAKTRLALEALLPFRAGIEMYTASGEMGESLSKDMGFDTQVVYHSPNQQTEGTDSEQAALALLAADVDFILFAGGDGTARNICNSVAGKVPVLGVPAGVKIHSGVYAITPKSAGRVLAMILQGEMVSFGDAEVRDIDEDKFRQGKVQAKHFGEMRVPSELRYVQAVKSGGKEVEELVLADIAAEVIERMQDEPQRLFVMGSGSTVDAVMQELGLPNTLLGVDLVRGEQLIASDLSEQQLLGHLDGQQASMVITLIGGQGHVFGRGNQQLSPEVIRRVGRDNILLLATKSKLQQLDNRSLIVDTGDHQLDTQLAGLINVVCGYHDEVLYPISSNDD